MLWNCPALYNPGTNQERKQTFRGNTTSPTEVCLQWNQRAVPRYLLPDNKCKFHRQHVCPIGRRRDAKNCYIKMISCLHKVNWKKSYQVSFRHNLIVFVQQMHPDLKMTKLTKPVVINVANEDAVLQGIALQDIPITWGPGKSSVHTCWCTQVSLACFVW